MRATRCWPHPVNSRPTPSRRSPNRRYRISMYRIIVFLLLIALAALGAAWVADQPGDVLISWSGGHAHPSLPVFAMLLGIAIVAAILVWTILLAVWRTPGRIRRGRRERRLARG